MALTKQQCQQMIDACIEAELKVLNGKTVEFNGRKMIREDLEEIRAARHEWERKLAQLSRPSRSGIKLARF